MMGTKLARRSLFQGIGAVVFAKALERLPVLPAKWASDFDELVRTSSIVTLEPGDTLHWVRDAVGGYAVVIAAAAAIYSAPLRARLT
jgi:hypothetical protein